MDGGGRSLGAQTLLSLISVGPMSRGDLAERLGLSAATTTRTVRPLIEAGLIEEQPPVEAGGPGRPTRLLAVVAGSATVAGVKLTADRLYAVLTDPLGEVLAGESLPLTETDPDSVTALIASVVAQLAQRSGRRPDAVGISLGAAVAGRRTVVVASFLGWRDVPLAAMVTEATGLPCVAANDVRAFAYAEARFGAGRGKDPFAMVTLGAGIGCGVVVAGEVVSGAQGAAGSVGHLPVDPSGPSCEIGHPGCARALASTSQILRAAAKHLGCQAQELSLDLLLSPDMRRNDGVDDVLRRAALAVGRVVGTLIAYVDPELVVVSGEGVAVVETYRETFEKEVGGLRHWAAAPAPVLLRPFEFDEWARGAAALALDQWTVVAGGR
ncbi:transcriptional regulator [Actinomyces sp. HMSC075C01]|uniref:ROK family transcriptional regulator n=1 Tax=Actinomyces oris TaxID=544580 RepID=A0A1Q8WMM8_9ACTO|nr:MULTISPECIES: ROK family transcriptional regulator [Actinomyces]OFR59634.1 transcriptional regulator [Actinomyces sp. HMSC075C01]OLO68600.1 ROK family transcriptional regulator [Actinomyces oris]